jgi:dipeptidyl-peptidase 4
MLNSPASLPRQYARTRGFTLGVPRDFTIAPGGDRIVFLRSRGGADPVTCLWSLDVATGSEQLLADPAALDGGADREMAPEERTRRERRREQAGGITAYATDRAVRKAVFALSGQLWVADLDAALTRLLPARPPVTDPRLDPGGLAIAYISGGGLHVMSSDGANDVELAMPEDSQVVYGLPEHVAAESMGRHRGYWWAPDGLQLLVARVDSARVQRWYISDPAAPAREIAYPTGRNRQCRCFAVDLPPRRLTSARGLGSCRL